MTIKSPLKNINKGVIKMCFDNNKNSIVTQLSVTTLI